MPNIRENMVGKSVKKFGQGPPPPLFGQWPKEIDFSYGRCSLMSFKPSIFCSIHINHLPSAPSAHLRNGSKVLASELERGLDHLRVRYYWIILFSIFVIFNLMIQGITWFLGCSCVQ